MPRDAVKRKVWRDKYLLESKDKINESARAWKKRNPEKVKESQRAGKLKRIYGITEDDYIRLFNEQDGCCAICYKNETHFKGKLHIDHCHLTKKVRGLLCSNCNTALGLFKDNKLLMLNAINYMRSHYERLNLSLSEKLK